MAFLSGAAENSRIDLVSANIEYQPGQCADMIQI